MVIATVVAVLPILGPTAAGAATGNCGGVGENLGVGVTVGSNTSSGFHPSGARTNLTVRIPALCTGTQFPGTESRAYVRLFGFNSHGGSSGYAMIGFTHQVGLSAPRFFWAWFSGGTPARPFGYWGSPVGGSVHNFQVVRQSDGKLHMLLDGAAPPCNGDGMCPVTSFDPVNAWDFIQADVGASSDLYGDDLPGTGADKSNFDNVQELSSGTWSSHAWQADPPQYCWDHLAQTTLYSQFKVWTNPDHSC